MIGEADGVTSGVQYFDSGEADFGMVEVGEGVDKKKGQFRVADFKLCFS